MRIQIDVRRDDGEVTRLEGADGLAVMAQEQEWVALQDIDPAMVSLRCSSPMGLAVCLASVIAAVRSQDEDAYNLGCALADYFSGDRPDLQRLLPDYKAED